MTTRTFRSALLRPLLLVERWCWSARRFEASRRHIRHLLSNVIVDNRPLSNIRMAASHEVAEFDAMHQLEGFETPLPGTTFHFRRPKLEACTQLDAPISALAPCSRPREREIPRITVAPTTVREPSPAPSEHSLALVATFSYEVMVMNPKGHAFLENR